MNPLSKLPHQPHTSAAMTEAVPQISSIVPAHSAIPDADKAAMPKDPFEELKIRRAQIDKETVERIVKGQNDGNNIVRVLIKQKNQHNVGVLQAIDAFFPYLEQLNQASPTDPVKHLKCLAQTTAKAGEDVKPLTILDDQPEIKKCLHRALLAIIIKFIDSQNPEASAAAHRICLDAFLIFDLIDADEFPKEFLVQCQEIMLQPELDFDIKTSFLISLSTSSRLLGPDNIVKIGNICKIYFNSLKFDFVEERIALKKHLSSYIDRIPIKENKMVFLMNCIGFADYSENKSTRAQYLKTILEVFSATELKKENRVTVIKQLLKVFSNLPPCSESTANPQISSLSLLDWLVEHFPEEMISASPEINRPSLEVNPKPAEMNFQDLNSLREFLEKTQADSGEKGIGVEESRKLEIKEKVKKLTKIVLSNPCTIKTLKDAYRILELCDILSIHSEKDNTATLELILNAAEKLSKQLAKDPEFTLFRIRLFEESSKWGVSSNYMASSIQYDLNRTYQQALQIAEKTIRKDFSTTTELLLAIPDVMLEKEIYKKKFVELCEKYLEQANKVRTGKALRLSSTVIERKLLNIFTPEHKALISQMLLVVKHLQDSIPEIEPDFRREDYPQLGLQLKGLLNRHPMLSCHLEKDNFIFNAIKLYVQSESNNFEHIWFILKGCWKNPSFKLLKNFEEQILDSGKIAASTPPVEKLIKLYGLLAEACVECVKKDPKPSVAVNCLLIFEKAWMAAKRANCSVSVETSFTNQFISICFEVLKNAKGLKSDVELMAGAQLVEKLFSLNIFLVKDTDSEMVTYIQNFLRFLLNHERSGIKAEGARLVALLTR